MGGCAAGRGVVTVLDAAKRWVGVIPHPTLPA